jgi:Fe-S cluster assembly protein SufD
MESTATSRPSLLSNFDARGRELAARGPEWLRTLRRSGRTRFEQLGLPTTRLEQWRATSVAPLAGTEFVPAAGDSEPSLDGRLSAAAGPDLGGPRLVFVDGRFAPRLSTVDANGSGLWTGSLVEALETVGDRVRPHLTRRDPAQSQAFDALNAAFHEDGAVVLADAGADAGPPVHLIYVSSGVERPTAVHPRTLIAAERGSRLKVVETYLGPEEGVYFTNAVTDLVAGDDARVDHYRVQLEGPAAFHVSNVHSIQTRNSRCTLHQIDLGGRLVRHDVVSVLDGEGADCRLNGLYLADAEQHVDNHTLLDHARPHGSSHELYKGILTGRSRAVFNGRILVRQDAQETDAKQSNQNLLLSAGALARTRPQLEIYADDVKCTHGATVGRLDEDAVFYLRSRGIADADARRLMIAAFAGEVLERVEIDPLRSSLEGAVASRLAGAEEGGRA